ncbi:uncharacterized protein LOC126680141 [Mercurialis annua]|uniref:uncharacterized protein LOC126680141 n=1 Tax=Mercurialis annua TaxID=3986 RepID=UPI00215DF61E|nr:uncharacterized protein LOC126680141 [Mercurialis annua]
MQQRPIISSSRAQEAEIPVTQPIQQQQFKYSPRHSITEDDSWQLPLYSRSSTLFKKSSYEKLVHAVPLVVLICLFTLWWFSYPVNLEIKDGEIVGIQRVEMLQSLDNDLVEFAILASATPPEAAVSQNITMKNNETDNAPSVSKID